MKKKTNVVILKQNYSHKCVFQMNGDWKTTHKVVTEWLKNKVMGVAMIAI